MTHRSVTIWSAILHSTPAFTPHSPRWSATPIQHSKMTPECGVLHSMECHSKYTAPAHIYHDMYYSYSDWWPKELSFVNNKM